MAATPWVQSQARDTPIAGPVTQDLLELVGHARIYAERDGQRAGGGRRIVGHLDVLGDDARL